MYEDVLTIAFMDLRQFHAGHVLVIPRSHLPDVRTLDAVTGAAVMATVTKVAGAVGMTFPNQGLSLWHSMGPAAFQEVPHLHIHIHPRLQNDNILRVYPDDPPTSLLHERETCAALLRRSL